MQLNKKRKGSGCKCRHTKTQREKERERENLMDIINLLRDDSLSLQLELTGISKLSTGGKHAVEVFACVCVSAV